MPGGKPAGVACVQLDPQWRCRLFGMPARPAVCESLRPGPEMCGQDRWQAMLWLGRLEQQTAGAQSLSRRVGDPRGGDAIAQGRPGPIGAR